ncbi:hypothetical protein IW261DRAFT_1626248 [Armillaria novae-zelandiae]|uniref:Uncharacterized protein n=1 Tax=Armillaria novae-zelandiae TaxID=153914 RepID=A0AA39P7P5_9AGAR|nr:hypothetical protein IW261DRAFT_1626248 [Armillaria novae-zelandiae]
MSFKAILYVYILGGLTFIPLLLAHIVLFITCTSVPVSDLDVSKKCRSVLEGRLQEQAAETTAPESVAPIAGDVSDLPKTRKGWLSGDSTGSTGHHQFAKRNAICLQPKGEAGDGMPSVTKAGKLDGDDVGNGPEEAETTRRRWRQPWRRRRRKLSFQDG